jgi:ATP-dependent RNA helicase RhlE
MPSYKYSVYKSANRNGHGGRSSGPKKRFAGEYIDPRRFVQVAKERAEVEYSSTNKFSAIQDQAIPPALEGKDIIGIANTGTGKTAAFALPILQALMTHQTSRALIIAPTRELAQQIEQECRTLGKGTGATGALLIGGTGMGTQLRDLRAKPRIVIGTPGRIKDHVERGTLQLQHYNLVVLDEVDRMLDMGFINDVTFLLEQLAPVRQSFFFSATMEPKVSQLISTFSENPVSIQVKTGESSENVHQDVVEYFGLTDKINKLHDILIDPEVKKAIIFDETQRNVEKLSNELVARGFKADAIHGGKSQGQRERALESFKSNRTTILVATDVAARGIDVADITHVINYSQPHSYQDYVHRIGRAGRAGKVGYALTFVTK